MVSLTRACLFVGPGSDNAPGVARVASTRRPQLLVNVASAMLIVRHAAE